MDIHYRNREVRDLAWACFGPAMMISDQLTDDVRPVSNCSLTLTPDRENWLKHLDQDPQPLRAHIERIRSRRLGIYFEGLWHFFLQQDEAVELVAHNLPVRDGGITVGEFDCLYYCHQRRRHVHLELAVKFFLGNRAVGNTGPSSDWNEWWGPECKDRLDLKIRHLMDRQIQLADHRAATPSLEDLGIQEVAREVEIKGRLFQSVHDPLPLPRGYNSKLSEGHWVHIDRMPEMDGLMDAESYLVLPKNQWLSPAYNVPDTQKMDKAALHAAMQMHFDNETRPQLIAALDNNAAEQTRFFVVGNAWPTGNGERR